jgi:septum formation protein
MPTSLFLCSNSPRRVQILNDHHISFTQIDNLLTHEPERFDFETPKEYVIRLALSKAHASVANYQGLIMGGDTIVVNNQTIYGKPCNHKSAVRMLESLSGRRHKVITACALYDSETSGWMVCMDEAEVAFAPYNQEQVHDYIHNFQPFDKAGGYGIQDHPPFIDSVHGDYYTVMGLPINRLLKIFSHYGIVKSC